jgi:D-apionolactonase
METEAGSPLPELFPSLPGAVFPLYHALADVTAFAGGQVIPSRSSAPLRFEGLALVRGRRLRVLLASFAQEPQQVTLEGLEGPARARVLDAAGAEEAMREPEAFRARAGRPLSGQGGIMVELPPFALATVDIGEGAP